MCAVKAHFNWVDNGLANLQFQRGRPFVPEHGARAIIFDIAQPHGVGAGKGCARKAGAKSSRIIKSTGLLMAGRAGRRIVDAQSFVEKQHPAQRRYPVTHRIVVRCVVQWRDRCIIISGQDGVCVIVEPADINRCEVNYPRYRRRGGAE